MDTVLYHANCNDGFCAAWLCHCHFPNANYIPVQYNQDLPDHKYIDNMDILIVDFSYPREILEEISNRSKNIKVLDHHKTAQKNLEGLEYCIFDVNKSGARLTWEYLKSIGYYPASGTYTGMNWLVSYTEDRDLWKHSLPNTQEINTALRSYPFDFETWDELSRRTPESLIEEGRAIKRYKDTIINSHLEHIRFTLINDYKAAIVRCTIPNIASDIADEIFKSYDDINIAIINIEENDGDIYQLRSRNGVDVSEIAESYGGGGHKGAAAFKIPNFMKNSYKLPN